jgi:hypothetical protein
MKKVLPSRAKRDINYGTQTQRKAECRESAQYHLPDAGDGKSRIRHKSGNELPRGKLRGILLIKNLRGKVSGYFYYCRVHFKLSLTLSLSGTNRIATI